VSKGNNIKKSEMIKALEKSLGVVTTACREVGIARKRIMNGITKMQNIKRPLTIYWMLP